MALYAAGIIFFCFFYTAVVFNPEETAENLKKNGGFIPGIRPGKNTAKYLDYVLTRITVIGAIYLTLVCVMPEYMVIAQTGIQLFLGGTSLLIVVNVTVDTISQIQSHLLAHQYGDLIKKAKLKGRAALGRGQRFEGAGLREHHPSRAAGCRQGHAGRPAGRASRHAPALDRRHAARCGQGADAGRARGQGDHGARRARLRRDRLGADRRRTDGDGRRMSARSSTAIRAPRRRPNSSTRSSPGTAASSTT